jgi:hypothetical protein
VNTPQKYANARTGNTRFLRFCTRRCRKMKISSVTGLASTGLLCMVKGVLAEKKGELITNYELRMTNYE